MNANVDGYRGLAWRQVGLQRIREYENIDDVGCSTHPHRYQDAFIPFSSYCLIGRVCGGWVRHSRDEQDRRPRTERSHGHQATERPSKEDAA